MDHKFNEILMWLEDINNYINSILYFYSCPTQIRKQLDFKEILMYVSCVPEIIKDIKKYLYDLETFKD